jgi:hypothetical protein
MLGCDVCVHVFAEEYEARDPESFYEAYKPPSKTGKRNSTTLAMPAASLDCVLWGVLLVRGFVGCSCRCWGVLAAVTRSCRRRWSFLPSLPLYFLPFRSFLAEHEREENGGPAESGSGRRHNVNAHLGCIDV